MGALASMWMKLETLETLVATLKKKNEKGIDLTISIGDDSNEYGKNVSSYVAQSKEDREAGKQKFYTGNGQVFWTDGKIVKGEKKEAATAGASKSNEPETDLPF